MNILRKILKIAIALVLVFLLILTLLALCCTYHQRPADMDGDRDGIVDRLDPDTDGDGVVNPSDTDADNDGVANVADIVDNARGMTGVFYDYLKGGMNNLGGRLGFLVCYDIPRIAYADAGISLERLIRDDYPRHTSFYTDENGVNRPDTPFFFRRTRNLYSYCQANGKLLRNCTSPRPGDVVFYGRFHIALVVEVHGDGTYHEVETAPWTICSVEHKDKKWVPIDVGRILLERR